MYPEPVLQTLTAILVSGPANAPSFSLAADGSWMYAPTAGFSGTTTFTYKANDGQVDSNTVTVTITVASDAYVSNANWSTSYSAGRSLSFTFPAYVAPGAIVMGGTFRHTYRSDTAGDTTCYFFETYLGGTLIGTHGSSGSPISCNSTFTYATDTVALPEVDTVAEANAVTVKLYVWNSGGRRSQHRLATVTLNYRLD
jgi:hypothetical protein